MLNDMIVFAIAFTASAATPGPDIMAIFGRALGSGRYAAVSFAVGIILGKLILLTLAVLGLAVAAQALGPLFALIKLGGAAYLIWLGLRFWYRSSTTAQTEMVTTNASWRDMLTGLALACSNPHAIIFYVALLPTIVEMQSIDTITYLALCAILITAMTTIVAIYVLLAERVGRLLRSKRARCIGDRVAGSVIIVAGVIVMTR
jgi:threonine/homoserine/homoserine lactone efflux protein